MSELWSNISTKTSFLHIKPTLSQQQHWHVWKMAVVHFEASMFQLSTKVWGAS